MNISLCIGVALIVVQLAAGVPNNASSRLLVLASSQFEEPLVATAPTSPGEDNALVQAIQAYRK